MKKLHRAVTVSMAVGGLALAGAGVASAQPQAGAVGHATASPGVGSGNLVQVPVHVPVKVCGNTVNVVGLLNPAFTPPCPTV